MTYLFRVRIDYFKANGRYYATENVEWQLPGVSGPHGITAVPSYAYDKVRSLWQMKGLPGLGNEAKWEGFILLTVDGNEPYLLLPVGNK